MMHSQVALPQFGTNNKPESILRSADICAFKSSRFSATLRTMCSAVFVFRRYRCLHTSCVVTVNTFDSGSCWMRTGSDGVFTGSFCKSRRPNVSCFYVTKEQHLKAGLVGARWHDQNPIESIFCVRLKRAVIRCDVTQKKDGWEEAEERLLWRGGDEFSDAAERERNEKLFCFCSAD